MKAAVCNPQSRSVSHFRYPNAATRREILHKVLDTLLIAASGMGIAAMLLLYLVLV